MGTKVDLCSILNAAKGLGVHLASKSEKWVQTPSLILGTNYISPLTMATAYAGIANNGTVCTPVAIDRVVNPDGTDHAVSKTTCTQGLKPEIAAGVTYALQGVIRGGGTAASANPYDGTPIMAKTGTTDDSLQNWLITSTTKVATATWVGNVSGSTPLRSLTFKGVGGGNVKFSIAKPILKAIDALYGGDDFAKPTDAVLYGDQITMPDVTGKAPDVAQKLLEGLGLDVTVDSTPVDSDQPAGTVAASDPQAGASVSNGDSVTLTLSNGSRAQGGSTGGPTAPASPTPTPTNGNGNGNGKGNDGG
jgi:membrane peptidoglycan carboxypeptidase